MTGTRTRSAQEQAGHAPTNSHRRRPRARAAGHAHDPEREPGWVVCGEATTGRQALDMAFELKPDVIVLDLGLPEMNGVEVTRQVRSQPARGRADRHRARLPIGWCRRPSMRRERLRAQGGRGRTLADAVRAILRHGEFFSERVRPAADLGSFGVRQERDACVAGV